MEVQDLSKPLEEIKKTIPKDNKTALFLMEIVEEVIFKLEEGYYHLRDKLAEFKKIDKSQVS